MRTIVILATSVIICGSNAQIPEEMRDRQGLADMLLEYLAVRYPAAPYSEDIIYISAQRQRLFLVHDGGLFASYPISTASAGLGGMTDSFRTPTGMHRVAEKIGDGVPLGGVFRERYFTGQVLKAPLSGNDAITTRILWLEGLEPGVNQGGAVDSHSRAIYIHGTPEINSLGSPASQGCVRMRDADVMALFEVVPIGTLVVILDN